MVDIHEQRRFEQMGKAKHSKSRFKDAIKTQYAAVPIRLNEAGSLEILLLTSRNTGRWVILKGWPMRKLRPNATAAREAYEEAGIEGTIRPKTSIGNYDYAKNVEVGEISIRVKVFLLHVDRQLEAWPEQAERETRWFSPEEAADLVAEPDLAAIIRSTRDLIGKLRS